MFKRCKGVITLLVILNLVLSISLRDSFASDNENLSNEEIERLAHREAIRAANNPDRFHDEIKDISAMGNWGAMTVEMAKFYWALAAVEFSHCILSRDSTQCSAFVESLKDPATHIGFALFMKTNKMTLDMAQIISRGKINPGMASYLGLATGMMAQSIFQDLYYHPNVQALFEINKIRDPEKRKKKRAEVMNKLWNDFIDGSGQYLFNKIPNVMGLLGAAYLSHKTTQVLGHLFKKSDRLVKFAFNKRTSKAIIKFGRGLYKQRKLAKAGIKFIWNGSKFTKINPVVAIGSTFIETVIFLVWAPIVEDFVMKHWDRSHARDEISENKEKIEYRMKDNEHGSIIGYWAEKLTKSHDRFRETIMHKAQMTKMRHLISIQKVDVELQKIMMYNEWLVSGMDFESDLWVNNQHEFHDLGYIDSINEASKMAEKFFCGKSPNEAVERDVEVGGIPMPFSWDFDYRFDKNRTYYQNMRSNDGLVRPAGVSIDPYKVYHVEGLCETDLRKANWGKRPGPYDKVLCPVYVHTGIQRVVWKWEKRLALACRIDQGQARRLILKTGMHRGRNLKEDILEALDNKTAKVMRKVWSQRDLMIMRYEESIREELIKALTGRDDVEIDGDNLTINGDVDSAWAIWGGEPLGLMPHIGYEIKIWEDYYWKYPKYRKEFRKILKQLYQKKKAAKNLFNYTRMPYATRVRAVNFFQEIPRHDWEKVVHEIRSYIIP